MSTLTFWWITRIILNGFKTSLTRQNLWNLETQESSKNISKKFNVAWKKLALKYEHSLAEKNAKQRSNKRNSTTENGHELEKIGLNVDFKKTRLETSDRPVKRPSLALCLCKTYYGKFIAGSFLKFIQDFLNFVPSIVLNHLINYFNDKEQNVAIGVLYGFILLICLVAKTLLYNHYINKMTYVGARVRTSLMNLIYEKSLNLSSNSRRLTSVGEMSNLITVDSQVFIDFMTYVNMIWSAPLQIFICIICLWQYLGVASLAGLAVMLLSIPLNAYISEQSRKMDVKKLLFQDSRIKMINELLNGIRVIKFYGWELSFQKIIDKIRKSEVAFLIKSAFLKCATNFTWDCSPILVASTTFITFVLIDKNNKLDANITFVSLTLLDVMRFPVMILPLVISSLIKANVSLNRIANFLLKEEINPDLYEKESVSSNS